MSDVLKLRDVLAVDDAAARRLLVASGGDVQRAIARHLDGGVPQLQAAVPTDVRGAEARGGVAQKTRPAPRRAAPAAGKRQATLGSFLVASAVKRPRAQPRVASASPASPPAVLAPAAGGDAPAPAHGAESPAQTSRTDVATRSTAAAAPPAGAAALGSPVNALGLLMVNAAKQQELFTFALSPSAQLGC